MDLKLILQKKAGIAKLIVNAIIEFPITFPTAIEDNPLSAARIEAIDSSGSIPIINAPIIKGDMPYIIQTSFKLSKKTSAAKKIIKQPVIKSVIQRISDIMLF